MIVQGFKVEQGHWENIFNDGRLRLIDVQGDAGYGFRAQCPVYLKCHGEDYSWGPLSDTANGAVALLEAQAEIFA